MPNTSNRLDFANARRKTRRLYARTLYACRDAWNLCRYGRDAPRSCELILVRLSNVRAAVVKRDHVFRNKYASGRILADCRLEGRQIVALSEAVKVQHCIRRWVDGKSWEEAGVFEFYRHMGFKEEAIQMRHERLDAIFDMVRREGRLRSQAELDSRRLREEGGIRIHLDPHGAPLFADGGAHRIAMGLILGFEKIPAQIGCVHESGIPHVPRLRPG